MGRIVYRDRSLTVVACTRRACTDAYGHRAYRVTDETGKAKIVLESRTETVGGRTPYKIK